MWERSKGPVRSYIWGIAISERSNYHRQKAVWRRTSVVESSLVPEPPAQANSLLENLGKSAEELPEAQRQDAVLNALRRCLEELPANERQVIQLIDIGLGDLRQTDVAEELGLGDATVMRIKRRALARLRACLEARGFTL